jgi:hypothetical protein
MALGVLDRCALHTKNRQGAVETDLGNSPSVSLNACEEAGGASQYSIQHHTLTSYAMAEVHESCYQYLCLI